MKVVGVDLGVRTVHVASESCCRTFKAEPHTRHDELRSLITALKEFYPDSYYIVEEPVVAGARNLRTSLQMAQVSGAILASFVGIAVPVPQWKKAIVGKGNASKDDVKAFMRQQPEYKYTGDNQDWIDAMCLRMYGLLEN